MIFNNIWKIEISGVSKFGVSYLDLIIHKGQDFKKHRKVDVMPYIRPHGVSLDSSSAHHKHVFNWIESNLDRLARLSSTRDSFDLVRSSLLYRYIQEGINPKLIERFVLADPSL